MAEKRRGGKRETWAQSRRLNPAAAAALLEVLRRSARNRSGATEIPSDTGVSVTVVTNAPPAARPGWTRRRLPSRVPPAKPLPGSVAVGKRWLLVPTAWRTPPRTERCILRIEPGMAFGSGEHETTRLCLRLMEGLNPSRSFLDVGTGSGILAIAALLLGFRWAVGIDSDRVALRAARLNARFNGCSERLRLRRAMLESWSPPGRFDAIAANLLANLLSAQAARLASWLAPGGTLLISGVLRSQENAVDAAFRAAGLSPIMRLGAGRWRAATFARRAASPSATS